MNQNRLYTDHSFRQKFDLAQNALEEGDYTTALFLGEGLLEERGIDIELLNLCGVAATYLDELDKAQLLFEKVLRFDPDNGAVHHNYAALLEKRGRYRESRTHLEKAIERQPDFPEAYINLGNVLDELGEADLALVMYKEALRRDPSSTDAGFNLGHLLNRLGRFDEALHSFQQVQNYGGDPGCLNGCGLALTALGEADRALDSFNRALDLDPRNAAYHYNRSLLHIRNANLESALSDLDRAIGLDASLVDARLEKTALLVEAERDEEAWNCLEGLDDLAPLSPEVPLLKAALCEREGRFEEALSYLERSLERDPDSSHVLNNKGNVLIDLGRLEEARLCFDRILSKNERHPLAHYNLACVHALQGKVQDAVTELSRATDIDPTLCQDALDDPDFEAIRRHQLFMDLTGGCGYGKG